MLEFLPQASYTMARSIISYNEPDTIVRLHENQTSMRKQWNLDPPTLYKIFFA